MIQVENNLAKVEFARFGLAEYGLFLKCKKLPESQLAYDWRRDTYTLTTPARFAAMLGAEAGAGDYAELPLAAHLFDYQRFIVTQALQSERYAVYADCGLGKTVIFLEFARHVLARTGGKVLILSPKSIIAQTVEEAARWYGDTLPVERIETRAALSAWLKSDARGLAITNYEKMIDGQLPELRLLAGLVLDESSILKSGGGVIKWNLIKSAKGIQYKLSCTATPAPNDIMEYASQASFLERLRNEGEILWTFFSRDKHSNWRIKPHAQAGFYRFLASWSIYLRNPAHYGWRDNLADVPAPCISEDAIAATPEQMQAAQTLWARRGSGLFGEKGMGVRERSKLSQLAKGFIYEDGTARSVPSNKPAAVAEIAREHVRAGRQTLIWTVFDEESRILSGELFDVTHATLEGETKEAARLEILERFRHGEIPLLISKPALLGFGMNFQFCKAMIFSGWDDSYERFYQAVRRAYRYGQTDSLHVHIPVVRELEGMILDNILRKKEGFERDAETQEAFYLKALDGLARAAVTV